MVSTSARHKFISFSYFQLSMLPTKTILGRIDSDGPKIFSKDLNHKDKINCEIVLRRLVRSEHIH